MKLVSWNVNGIRAAIKKDFMGSFASMNCDVLCLQETKAQDEQVIEALAALEGYEIHTNSAVKKGYSGTAVISRQKPISVTMDMGIEEHDQEGRIIAAEFEQFFLVTVYTPNSKNDGVVFKSSANAAAYPARERFNEDATSVISEQKS